MLRTPHISTVVALGVTSVSALSQIQSLPSSFSEQEIRDGARAGDKVSDRKPYTAAEALKAATFSGYVGGFIDAKTDGPNPEPTLAECLRTKPRPRIVQRAAAILADPSNKPVGSVRFDVGLAVIMACKDEYWGAATQPAVAPPWTKFGENGRLVAYFQRAPEGSARLPVAWVMYDYKTEQQSERSNRRYWSEKAKQEVDCSQARTRTTYFTWHHAKMGDGQVVYTGRTALPWEPTSAPGSTAAALATALCSSK